MDLNTFIPVTSITSCKNFPVTADVFCLPIQIVNIAAIGNPKKDKEWVLVDAGMPKSADTILNALKKHFDGEHPPKCIIITHGHFDHVGGLLELVERWNVPVYCHASELPFLTGIQEYPPPDPASDSGLIAKMSRLFPREPVNLSPTKVFTLPPDGSIPDLPDWRWIHTPGHTPGHISLFRDSDGFLIAGDLISNVKQESLMSVVMQSEELHGPPSYFTPDWETAWDSIKKLAELRPHSLIPGHGRPISSETLADDLQKLAENFDKNEIPTSGIYAPTSCKECNK